MKMVIALISKEQVEEITQSLSSLGISGMTLCEVKCPTDDKVFNRAVKVPYYKPKVKIEIAINDDKVDQLVNILSSEDIDSDISVNEICVWDIIDSIRIRTGEKGDRSL